MRSNRGFTMIEMLAATALAAALMVAVLGVTASLGRSQQRLLRQSDSTSGWRTHLLDLLRDDLLSAETVISRDGRLEIAGYCAIDPATLEPTHQPARVVYAIQKLNDEQWLVRRQALLSGRERRSWLVPICSAVESFEVRGVGRAGERGTGDDGKSKAEAPADAAASPQVPQRVEVTIRWRQPDRPPLTETLLVR